MRLIKSSLAILAFAICLPMSAQTPVYEDLIFEADSMTTPYKPLGKNYAFVKSKRGTDGVARTSRADSIMSFPVTEIVLVFSELNSSSINNRLEANQERWENLLRTYPQFFQFSTTLKEMCQCKIGGDTAIFKKGNGFYIYFTGEEPKVAQKETKDVIEEKKVEPKKTETKPVATNVKEESKKEKQKEPEKEADDAPMDGPEQTVSMEMPKDAPKKKPGYTKPRRAKDPKACRLPCYESGDEDLNAFFKDNITLSKKQKRHSKQLISVLKLQLNLDGSIKKAMVTGVNEGLNKQVLGSVSAMNSWNPAVKSGATVKSEVKITLKYDRETKSMKPFEIAIIPRPAPKCKCLSDTEIFGSD